jgi:CelD/BcsL family acetyltransferase involved in cellulose biosynthesis
MPANMDWKFTWIDDLNAVAMTDFVRRWQALVDNSPQARVFHEPVIVRAWLESKGAALGALPSFCWGARDDGCQVLVPFCRIHGGWRRAWERRLISVGEPHFDYQNPVGTAGQGGVLPWAEFWTSLTNELERAGRFERAMLLRLSAEGAPSASRPDGAHESPYICLAGCRTLEDLLEQRPQKHRTDVRRQLRRLNEQGLVELQVYGPQQLAETRDELDRMRAAYEDLWEGAPSARLFRQPGTLAFYERLLDLALPPGLVHFSVLRLGDRPISWHFGFLHRAVLHWYKPTYDKQFERFSPGKVHLASVIEHGLQHGWKEIDLGCGQEDYKYRWTNTARALLQWQWEALSWRGRLVRCAKSLARPARSLVRLGTPLAGP